MNEIINNLTPDQKSKLLDDLVKLAEGHCNSCSGDLESVGEYKIPTGNAKIVSCRRCNKNQGGDTFLEAYLLFAIRK